MPRAPQQQQAANNKKKHKRQRHDPAPAAQGAAPTQDATASVDAIVSTLVREGTSHLPAAVGMPEAEVRAVLSEVLDTDVVRGIVAAYMPVIRTVESSMASSGGGFAGLLGRQDEIFQAVRSVRLDAALDPVGVAARAATGENAAAFRRLLISLLANPTFADTAYQVVQEMAARHAAAAEEEPTSSPDPVPEDAAAALVYGGADFLSTALDVDPECARRALLALVDSRGAAEAYAALAPAVVDVLAACPSTASADVAAAVDGLDPQKEAEAAIARFAGPDYDRARALASEAARALPDGILNSLGAALCRAATGPAREDVRLLASKVLSSTVLTANLYDAALAYYARPSTTPPTPSG